MGKIDQALIAQKAQQIVDNSTTIEKKILPSKESKKGVGRPKTGRAITMTVQVDRETYQNFIEKCNDLGLSNSSAIRMAMKLWLKN